jgi:DNA-directed RNA polymerase specialized sigma24 family protein
MPNCRSISSETWAHARECLIFYFSRRHARSNAEDLAQETLLTIWKREDYEFASEEDFLKVCYGFARLISKEGYRETQRDDGSAVDDFLPAPPHGWGGQRATESRLLLAQVWEIGRSQLQEKDWRVIEQATDSDWPTVTQELNLGTASNARVRLHRARKKLAKLVGFK